MLRLLTWNVRYFSNLQGGLRSSTAGLEAIVAALDEVDADLVLLQEVEEDSWRAGSTGRAQAERLSEALQRRGLSYRCVYYPAHRYQLGDFVFYTTGLCTLIGARLELVADNSSRPHDITYRRFPALRPLKQTRVCGQSRLRFEGREFDLYNTHLSLPAFLSPQLLQLPLRMGWGQNQIEEARQLLDFIGDTPGPALLAGDFNSLPDSPVYRLLTESGWVDAFRKLLPAEHYVRWKTQGLGPLQLHLDHIFSTPDIDWIDAEESHPWGEGRFQNLSDHVPKLCRFRLER